MRALHTMPSGHPRRCKTNFLNVSPSEMALGVTVLQQKGRLGLRRIPDTPHLGAPTEAPTEAPDTLRTEAGEASGQRVDRGGESERGGLVGVPRQTRERGWEEMRREGEGEESGGLGGSMGGKGDGKSEGVRRRGDEGAPNEAEGRVEGQGEWGRHARTVSARDSGALGANRKVAAYDSSPRGASARGKGAPAVWGESPLEVLPGDIYTVVEEATGIPAGSLEAGAGQGGGAKSTLGRLEEALRRAVVGQEGAVRSVVGAIRVGRLLHGASESRRRQPMASFALVGPRGVGKALLCATVARELFGSEDSVVRLNLSEYSQSSAVARLIGAPAGYVGYGRGGMLTQVRSGRTWEVGEGKGRKLCCRWGMVTMSTKNQLTQWDPMVLGTAMQWAKGRCGRQAHVCLLAGGAGAPAQPHRLGEPRRCAP